MNLPHKTVYALLVSFGCINLIVRYPTTPHGVGVDSFSFQVLSNSILVNGYAAWIVHPLSPLGLYPLSYPSGSFFLTAAVAAMGGTTIELTALILSLFVGVFGIFTAFAMGREFFRDDTFALIVALFFSLMPKFVTNTLWEVPARGLLMALTPFFIWAILRLVKAPNLKHAVVATLVFLLMSLFHRLAVLMLVVFLAFLVTMIFAVASQIVRKQFPSTFMSPAFRKRSRVLLLVLYALIIGGLLLGSGVLDAYEQGAMYQGSNPLGEFVNLAVSLSRSVGVIAVLAVIGVPLIIFRRNKAAAEYLYLSTPLAIIPTLFLRSYTGFYVVTFFALFIGAGCVFLLHRLPRQARGITFATLIVVASISATQAVAFELPHQTFMSESEYSTGLYARYQVAGTIASNDGLLGSRVASVTGRPYLPVGGATTALYGPDAMAFGFVRSFGVTPVNIRDLTIDADSLFTPDGVTVGADWSVMMSEHLSGRTTRIAGTYNVTYILEDRSSPGIYHTGWGVDYESFLLRDTYATRYKVFETDQVRLWLTF